MQTVIQSAETLRGLARKLGPYLMLEILLPGGTFVALVLFLYRRRTPGGVRDASRSAPAVARAGVTDVIFGMGLAELPRP